MSSQEIWVDFKICRQASRARLNVRLIWNSKFQQEKDAASLLQSEEHTEAEKEAEKPESETNGLGWKGFQSIGIGGIGCVAEAEK